MSRKNKNFVLIISISLFILLSYFLIIYSLGYKFDFNRLKFVKTGSIFIKLNVGNAKIYLNGELSGKTSLLFNNFTKKNLIPKSYDLKIAKEGYYEINKKIQIEPGETLSLTNVYLIKNEGNEEFKKNLAKLSEDEKILNEKLLRINFKNLAPIAYYIFDNDIYFISPKDFLLYKTPINSDFSKDYEKRQVSLTPIEFNREEINKIKIKILDNNTIYLIDGGGGLYYLENGDWRKVDKGVKDVALSLDKKKLAILKENEINVLWLKDDNQPPFFKKDHKELVLRVSKEIKNIYWFKNWHLIYVFKNDDVHFIEVDPRGGRNDFLISRFI